MYKHNSIYDPLIYILLLVLIRLICSRPAKREADNCLAPSPLGEGWEEGVSARGIDIIIIKNNVYMSH
jgi:hypothetical protein